MSLLPAIRENPLPPGPVSQFEKSVLVAKLDPAQSLPVVQPAAPTVLRRRLRRCSTSANPHPARTTARSGAGWPKNARLRDGSWMNRSSRRARRRGRDGGGPTHRRFAGTPQPTRVRQRNRSRCVQSLSRMHLGIRRNDAQQGQHGDAAGERTGGADQRDPAAVDEGAADRLRGEAARPDRVERHVGEGASLGDERLAERGLSPTVRADRQRVREHR